MNLYRRSQQVVNATLPRRMIARQPTRFIQCDENRTGRVRIGLHSRLLPPSAIVILFAEQFLDERLFLFRGKLQFIGETKTEDLVFGVGGFRRRQPFLDCGCSRRNLALLRSSAVSIQPADRDVVAVRDCAMPSVSVTCAV